MHPILSFDLDGTIVTSSYADHVWLEGLPKLYATEKNTTLKQAKKTLFTAYDEISDARIEWYDISYWFQRYNLHSSWIDLLQKYTPYITPYEEAIPLIKHLAQHYPLIITSNAKREFIEIQLKHTNLHPYFTALYSSISDFNKVKKEPAVYQGICTQHHIHPQQLIHIGDHEQYDYHAPKKIGVHAYYLNRKKTTSSHSEEVTSLTQFVETILPTTIKKIKKEKKLEKLPDF